MPRKLFEHEMSDDCLKLPQGVFGRGGVCVWGRGSKFYSDETNMLEIDCPFLLSIV